MRLSQLETFVAVAEHGSMVAAARALAYSTSTVSTHVRALERQTGVTLVARSSDGCGLTAGGRALVVVAQRILALHASLPTVAAAATARRGAADGGTVQARHPGSAPVRG